MHGLPFLWLSQQYFRNLSPLICEQRSKKAAISILIKSRRSSTAGTLSMLLDPCHREYIYALLPLSVHAAMTHYPYRHSTYYTRVDDEFVSELPVRPSVHPLDDL